MGFCLNFTHAAPHHLSININFVPDCYFGPCMQDETSVMISLIQVSPSMGSTAIFDVHYSLPNAFLKEDETSSSLGESSESRGGRIRPQPHGRSWKQASKQASAGSFGWKFRDKLDKEETSSELESQLIPSWCCLEKYSMQSHDQWWKLVW